MSLKCSSIVISLHKNTNSTQKRQNTKITIIHSKIYEVLYTDAAKNNLLLAYSNEHLIYSKQRDVFSKSFT
jgi:hypothetical protein